MPSRGSRAFALEAVQRPRGRAPRAAAAGAHPGRAQRGRRRPTRAWVERGEGAHRSPATSSRWCCPAVHRRGAPRTRSTPTGRCARSTRRRTCTSWTSSEAQVAGSSPEVLVKVQGDVAVTHPIAGTRRRGSRRRGGRRPRGGAAGRSEGARRARDAGGPRPQRPRPGQRAGDGHAWTTSWSIERYSHVMHIASRVSGRLAAGNDRPGRVRRRVSGGDRVRVRRRCGPCRSSTRPSRWPAGPYAGAVGYFDLAGNLDTCITLRTVLFHERHARTSRPGRASSPTPIPVAEAKETRDKAEALLAAVGAASQLASRARS